MNSQRGQAVLISLQNDPDTVGGKTVRWIVLSGEGHGSGMNGLRLQAGYVLFAPPMEPDHDRVGSSGG
jgi:hypothetical protein